MGREARLFWRHIQDIQEPQTFFDGSLTGHSKVPLDSALDGTFNGRLFEGTFEGTSDGTSESTSDGTFEGTSDGTLAKRQRLSHKTTTTPNQVSYILLLTSIDDGGPDPRLLRPWRARWSCINRVFENENFAGKQERNNDALFSTVEMRVKPRCVITHVRANIL